MWGGATSHMKKPEDSYLMTFLSFYLYVGARDRTLIPQAPMANPFTCWPCSLAQKCFEEPASNAFLIKRSFLLGLTWTFDCRETDFLEVKN